MEIDKTDNKDQKIKKFKYKFQSNVWDIAQTILWLSVLLYLTFYINISKTLIYFTYLFIFLLLIFLFHLIFKILSKVTINEKEIVKSSLIIKTILNWHDISEIKLNYYSTRRDKERGWMVLFLLSKQKKIVIHSSISSFDVILEKIGEKTYSNNYLFNYYTENNFKAMGINLYNRD